jgi:hypothetical protein
MTLQWDIVNPMSLESYCALVETCPVVLSQFEDQKSLLVALHNDGDDD